MLVFNWLFIWKFSDPVFIDYFDSKWADWNDSWGSFFFGYFVMYSFILFRYAFILIYCFSIYVSTVEFLLKQCKVIYHIKILITIINAWMLVIVSLNFVCCFLFVCLLEILVNKKLVFLLMNSGHPSSKNKIKIYLTK